MPEAAFSGACSLLRLLPGGRAHGQQAPPSTGDPGRGGRAGGRRRAGDAAEGVLVATLLHVTIPHQCCALAADRSTFLQEALEYIN